MVEDWVDALCRRWEVDNGIGGTVYAYRMYERAEFPEALTVFPCALTIPKAVIYHVTAANSYSVWRGETEFHLSPSAHKSELPLILQYYQRIAVSLFADITLGGRVEYVKLRTEGGEGIIGPVALTYGAEDPHWGMVAHWVLKESLSIAVS